MTAEQIFLSYIEQLPLRERLKLIQLLVQSALQGLAETPKPIKGGGLMQYAGAGKRHAMQQDAQSHISQIRSEWD